MNEADPIVRHPGVRLGPTEGSGPEATGTPDAELVSEPGEFELRDDRVFGPARGPAVGGFSNNQVGVMFLMLLVLMVAMS